MNAMRKLKKARVTAPFISLLDLRRRRWCDDRCLSSMGLDVAVWCTNRNPCVLDGEEG